MIRRRHVIYVPGYDPRGYIEYYRMFRTDYRHFQALYRLRGTVERQSDAAKPHASIWSVKTQGDGWEVDTTYEFLRWEDIIRKDFERPPWRIIPAAFRDIGITVLNGVLLRIFRAHWRFGLFIAYPFILFVLLVLVSAGLGAGAGWMLGTLGVPRVLADVAAAVIGGMLLIGAIVRAEPRTYMMYLFQDVVSTLQFANRKRPDWEQRLDLFARSIVDTIRTSNADEILIVGHSSGSFLAVDVAARALALDPDLGRRGPQIVLLTMGGNLPIVGFHPGAEWFRERLRRIASEASLPWVDYQSRRDIMNFFRFDPVKAHRLDKPGAHWPNPKVVPVQFRNIVGRERYARLQWRFFDLHFQFLRANNHPDAYDYFMIVAGPFSLRQRLAHPEDVTSAVASDDEAAQAAWKRLIASDDPQAPPASARTAAGM